MLPKYRGVLFEKKTPAAAHRPWGVWGTQKSMSIEKTIREMLKYINRGVFLKTKQRPQQAHGPRGAWRDPETNNIWQTPQDACFKHPGVCFPKNKNYAYDRILAKLIASKVPYVFVVLDRVQNTQS